MKRVVTFGEIMLRLAPNGYYRFFQNDQMQATFGGGEANVAVSLANFGLDSAYVTKLPKHAIGQAAVDSLRYFGVDTTNIVRGGDPTVRDRVTATKMGMHAVELLLEGKSNLVVIEEDGKIDSMDIVFALTVDKVYKKKMTIEEAKVKYNDEQIAELERIIEKRRAEIDELYAIAQTVCN